MSVKQMSLVWDLDLEHSKKYVLLAYADHADDDGDNVYPSLGRVAHKTGYSRDAARRISRQLVEANLMVLVEPADAARRQPARYKLTLENGTALGPFKPRVTSSNLPPAPPSHLGVNDPSHLGAPMQPEPSLEPSVPPTEGSELPSTKGKDYDDMTVKERQSYFLAYLHDRLTERNLLKGKPFTGPLRKQYAGEIAAHLNKGASKARILLALDHLVFRWPDDRISFTNAFDTSQKNETRRHLKAVPDEAARPKKRVL